MDLSKSLFSIGQRVSVLEQENAHQQRYISQLEAENKRLVSRLLQLDPSFTPIATGHIPHVSKRSSHGMMDTSASPPSVDVTDAEFDQLLDEVTPNPASPSQQALPPTGSTISRPFSPNTPNNPNNSSHTSNHKNHLKGASNGSISANTANTPNTVSVLGEEDNVAEMDINSLRDMKVLHRPITWRECSSWIRNPQTSTSDPIGRYRGLGRSEACMARYLSETREYKKYFASGRDKILIIDFKCRSVHNSEGRLVAVIDEAATPRWKLLPNSYPYHFTRNIRHFLVFSRVGRLDSSALDEIVCEQFDSRDYAVLHWETPAPLQTIRNLWHAHVIVARKDTIESDGGDEHRKLERQQSQARLKRRLSRTGSVSYSYSNCSVGSVENNNINNNNNNVLYGMHGINGMYGMHAVDAKDQALDEVDGVDIFEMQLNADMTLSDAIYDQKGCYLGKEDYVEMKGKDEEMQEMQEINAKNEEKDELDSDADGKESDRSRSGSGDAAAAGTKKEMKDNKLNFTEIKAARHKMGLLEQYHDAREMYENRRQFPGLCWSDICLDVAQKGYLTLLRRNPGASDNPSNPGAIDSNATNPAGAASPASPANAANTTKGGSGSTGFGQYYATLGRLFERWHLGAQDANETSQTRAMSQKNGMDGMRKHGSGGDDALAWVVENTRRPFETQPGIVQKTIFTLTKGTNGTNGADADANTLRRVRELVVAACEQEGLGQLLEPPQHSPGMIFDFKARLESNSSHRAFSCVLVRVPACLLGGDLGPFGSVPNEALESRGKVRMMQNQDFVLSVFYAFVCDVWEYYKVFKYNIQNGIRFREITWTGEAYKYAHTQTDEDLAKLGRNERSFRRYLLNISKSKGVYCSTRDKILCIEFKCKVEKVRNAEGKMQLKAVEDESTPEAILVDNIYPYWFCPGIYQYLIFYRGARMPSDRAAKMVRKLVEEHFGSQIVGQDDLQLEQVQKEQKQAQQAKKVQEQQVQQVQQTQQMQQKKEKVEGKKGVKRGAKTVSRMQMMSKLGKAAKAGMVGKAGKVGKVQKAMKAVKAVKSGKVGKGGKGAKGEKGGEKGAKKGQKAAKVSLKHVEQPVENVVKDYCWWENPIHLKSIPDLNHIHLLIRNRRLYDLPIKSGVIAEQHEAYKWDKLVKMAGKKHLCWERLARDECVLRDYYKHMRHRLNVFSSLLDALLVHCFGLSLDSLDARSKRWEVRKGVISVESGELTQVKGTNVKAMKMGKDEIKGNVVFRYEKNEFGYLVEPGIENGILWMIVFCKDKKCHVEARLESVVNVLGVDAIESMVKQSTEKDKTKTGKYVWFESRAELKMMDLMNVCFKCVEGGGYFSVHSVHVMSKCFKSSDGENEQETSDID